MVWSIYARTFETGDLADTEHFQPIKFPSNMLIRGIRTWIIYYGNPVFSNLKMTVYSHDVLENAPKSIIHTSTNSFNLSDIKETHAYGLKEIYFSFNDFPVKKDDTYHICLAADSYTHVVDTSFLAWRVAWPDPVYTKNFTVSGTNFGTAPYMISGVVGALL